MKILTGMKIALGFAALILAWVVINRVIGCIGGPPPPPVAQGTVVPSTPSISEHDASIPQPGENQGGKLQIIYKPKPTKDNPTPKPDTVTVFVPREPRKNPPTFTNSFKDTPFVNLSWTPVREPYLEFFPKVLIGASFDPDRKLSPWGGVSMLRLFGKVDLGASLDVSGAGLFGSYVIFRDLAFGASYRAIPFRVDAARWNVQLAYRF